MSSKSIYYHHRWAFLTLTAVIGLTACNWGLTVSSHLTLLPNLNYWNSCAAWCTNKLSCLGCCTPQQKRKTISPEKKWKDAKSEKPEVEARKQQNSRDSLSFLRPHFHYCTLIISSISSPFIFSAMLGFVFSGENTQEMNKSYFIPFTFFSADGPHWQVSHRILILPWYRKHLLQLVAISRSAFTQISAVVPAESKPHCRLQYVAKSNFFSEEHEANQLG